MLCPLLVLLFPSQVGKGPAAPHFPGQLHPAPPMGPTPQSPDNSVSGWCLNIPPHPTPPLSLPRKLHTSPQFPASEAADEQLERWVLTAPAPPSPLSTGSSVPLTAPPSATAVSITASGGWRQAARLSSHTDPGGQGPGYREILLPRGHPIPQLWVPLVGWKDAFSFPPPLTLGLARRF